MLSGISGHVGPARGSRLAGQIGYRGRIGIGGLCNFGKSLFRDSGDERAPALVGDKGRPVVEPTVTAEHSVDRRA
jgi:hypothetical protein